MDAQHRVGHGFDNDLEDAAAVGAGHGAGLDRGRSGITPLRTGRRRLPGFTRKAATEPGGNTIGRRQGLLSEGR